MPKHTHLLIGGPHDGARVESDHADPQTIPMFDLAASRPTYSLSLDVDMPPKHFYVRRVVTLGDTHAVVYVHEFYIGNLLESLVAGYRKP